LTEETSIGERWKSVVDRVVAACDRSGRTAADVRIVAVTKRVRAKRILEAYLAGIRWFGENYVQEALPKIEALRSQAPGLQWHFIGSLQSNKAKQVVGQFDLIHSLDRISLADALEKERKKRALSVQALIEVNVAEEQTKTGISLPSLKPLLEYVPLKTEIDVRALMPSPPLSKAPEKPRRYFARVRQLKEEILSWGLPRIQMKELSMGVTSDFEVAIEEGATIVRIGTAIFGPRSTD
jgi:PLP dependent protein